MELKELYDKTLKLFEISNSDELGEKLMLALNDDNKKKAFVELVNEDLTNDWLQMIFQYYQADRKNKKQDYTPKSVSKLISELVGKADIIIDLCAGTGALTIEKWNRNNEQKFELFEIDEKVIPYLLFNISIRNITAVVHRANILTGEVYETYVSKKGEKFANICNIQSAL